MRYPQPLEMVPYDPTAEVLDALFHARQRISQGVKAMPPTRQLALRPLLSEMQRALVLLIEAEEEAS